MFQRIRSSIVVQRLIVASVVYSTTLLLAKELAPEIYGELLLLVFVVKSMPLYCLGLSHGYIYEVSKGTSKKVIADYVYGYFLFCTIASVVFGVIYGIEFSILILIFSIVNLMEPVLKLKRNFLVSTYTELFLLLSYLFALYINGETANQYVIYLVSSVFVLMFSYFNIDSIIEMFRIHVNGCSRLKNRMRRLVDLVMLGVSSQFINLFIFSFMMIDRYFVKNNNDGVEFGSYMFAYQFVVLAMFVPSSINSKSIVDLSSYEIANGDYRLIVKIFGKSLLISLVGLLIVSAGVFIVSERFFSGYTDLIIYTYILGMGFSFITAYGAVSPVLFHERKLTLPNIIFASLPILSLLNHVFFQADQNSLKYTALLNSLFSILIVVCCVGYLIALHKKVEIS